MNAEPILRSDPAWAKHPGCATASGHMTAARPTEENDGHLR